MIYSEQSYSQTISSFMYKVFGLMAVGLSITGLIAYFCAAQGYFLSMLQTSPWLLFFIFVIQLAVVIAIAGFLNRLSYPVALSLFLIYSALVGLTLSSIFLIYTQTSIATTFFAAAGMFGAMAIYGYTTKSDLSGMGSLLLMALIGIIVGSLVNMFLGSASFDYLLSGAAVIIFTLLTAYDVQKIKMFAQYAIADRQEYQKFIVLGALTLYLDFINLFLNLLRFMGKRKE